MMVKPKEGGGRFMVHSKPSLCIQMNSSCCGLLCMWRFFQTTRAHRLHPMVFRELLREVDGLVDGHRSWLPQMGGSQHRTTQRTRSTSWKVLLCCLSYSMTWHTPTNEASFATSRCRELLHCLHLRSSFCQRKWPCQRKVTASSVE